MIDPAYIERWELNQISAPRRSQATIALNHLEEFTGHELNEVTGAEIERWMSAKVQAGYDVNTVAFYLNLVKPYFRWARRAGLIGLEQWIGIQEVKAPRGSTRQGVPRPYTRPEIARLWAELAAKHPPLDEATLERRLKRWKNGTLTRRRLIHHARYVQTKAIISLALYEGLRRNEIFTLDIDSLTPDNAYILVHGKRADHRPKTREVPWSPTARAAVAEHLRLRKAIWRPRHRSVWLALWADPIRPAAKFHRPMSHRQMRNLARLLGSGYELHRLRHTFATERLRAGMPIENLQKILGHTRIQQTLMYAELVRADLDKAMLASEDAFDAAVGEAA